MIAVDVLNFHCRVVHQNADGERQPSQGHDVDGFAQRTHDNDRSKNRERDGDRDDYRAAPASQEDQNHQTGENGRDETFAQHAVNGCADENRLVRQRPYLQLLRQSRLDPGQ